MVDRGPPPRFDVARRLLGEQHALATILGDHFLPSISFELLIALFLSEKHGVPLAAASLVQRIGPSPNVTWRWALALKADGLVDVDRADPTAILSLTQAGRDRVHSALDAIAQSERAGC